MAPYQRLLLATQLRNWALHKPALSCAYLLGVEGQGLVAVAVPQAHLQAHHPVLDGCARLLPSQIEGVLQPERAINA